MNETDITIIGAGIIGLGVAAHLSNAKRTVFVLEKNSSFGQEASSRNSEVIHAGIYYRKNSLKAVSCVEGREMLYRLCKEQNIGVKKIGKLIVAVREEEIGYLENLKKKAAQNGVTLEFLDKKQVKALEPEVSCLAGLYSPETGIVDSHGLMEFFLKQAQSKGAEVVYQAEVVGIKPQKGYYGVVINNQGETITLSSRVVINCAGNQADIVASFCGLDVDALGYRQYYLKGNYFRLSDEFRNKTHHLIYPVPNANSLGIHTVLDLSGGIRLGPDEEEVEKMNYLVNVAKKRDFFQSVKAFLPCAREEALIPDMAGIRPQLIKPNNGDSKDFIISHEEAKGFPGLINLVGIESPGLTASPCIARLVTQMVEKML